MSATSWVMISFGVLIIATRGPLIFAPQQVLAIYTRLMESVRAMRLFGVAVAVMGGLILWFIRDDVGLAAEITRYFAGFVGVMAVVVLIPFPGPIGRFGLKVWQSFNSFALRCGGLFAVLAGAALIYYGVN